MIRKAILFHHRTECGSHEQSPSPEVSSKGSTPGRFLALAGVSVAVAALFKAAKPTKTLTILGKHNGNRNNEEMSFLESEQIPGWDLLFERNSEPAIVIDADATVLLAVNHKVLQLTGFSRADLMRSRVSDLFITAPQNKKVDGSEICNLRTKEGAVVPVNCKWVPMMVADRDLRLVVLEVTHSTESKGSVMSAMGNRLSSARTQREAIQIILDTADQFFGWDACTFDYYSAESDLIQPVVVIDRINEKRKELAPVVVNAKPTARMRKVIEEGPQLTLRKPPVQMATDSVPIGDRNRPSASLMWVPIRRAGGVIGLLSIQSYELNAYTVEDLELLQALTDYGAGTLERIQAEEQVQALNLQLEKRVEERTVALQEAVRELETFSYSISHDMRAPLRAMEGYTSKLLDEFSGRTLEGDGLEYLSRISRAAVRLDMLIQDVLTYTSVARRHAPLSPVNLEKLLGDLIATYPNWDAPHVKIEVLPPLAAVLGNEALLTQCLSHLIDNALKFVGQSKAPIVRIWSESHGSVVRIWIEDNGSGIDPKDHERVFRLFERIHPAADFGGTGVGLTIVKKAVERMNGSVGFTSELGKGSKFWFELAAPSQL